LLSVLLLLKKQGRKGLHSKFIEDKVVLIAFLLEFLPVVYFLLDLNSLGISYFAVVVGARIEEALERLGELIGCDRRAVWLCEVLDSARFFDVDEELLLQKIRQPTFAVGAADVDGYLAAGGGVGLDGVVGVRILERRVPITIASQFVNEDRFHIFAAGRVGGERCF
jgi:hypothetical protein